MCVCFLSVNFSFAGFKSTTCMFDLNLPHDHDIKYPLTKGFILNLS